MASVAVSQPPTTKAAELLKTLESAQALEKDAAEAFTALGLSPETIWLNKFRQLSANVDWTKRVRQTAEDALEQHLLNAQTQELRRFSAEVNRELEDMPSLANGIALKRNHGPGEWASAWAHYDQRLAQLRKCRDGLHKAHHKTHQEQRALVRKLKAELVELENQ